MSNPILIDAKGPFTPHKELTPISVDTLLSDPNQSLENKALVLEPNESPSQVANFLETIEAVWVHFPVFTDGRGFTSGRELREQFQFKGEIRATGDVLVDQVYYLYRCGFDVFALRSDQSAEAALSTLSLFSVNYQAMPGDNSNPRYAK